MAQVQPINKKRNEVDRKVEANLKEIEEIKAATDMALRNVEMVDSAKVVVKGELRLVEEQCVCFFFHFHYFFSLI